MDILAIYMSPRKGGNTDILLDEFIRGARDAGAEVESIYPRKLKITGCIECGGCDETGICVLKDDMHDVYPAMIEARKVVVSVPIFFYGPPAQSKALVDRSQALWNRCKLDPSLKREDGKGFFIGVGATKGKNLFEGTELCIKYFLDALGLPLKMESLLYRRVEAKGSILEHPTAMEDVYQAGRRFASD